MVSLLCTMPYAVAPLAGAWVETFKEDICQTFPRLSRPLRARGLKHVDYLASGLLDSVAPLAGAWIETAITSVLPKQVSVAPFTGAWIETCRTSWSLPPRRVAPFTGAWIETCRTAMTRASVRSRALYGRVD